MQTELPKLPTVCSDEHKRSIRNSDTNAKSLPVEVKNHNTCRSSSNLVSNRKELHPLVGGPYRNSMRLYALSEPVRSTNKTIVGQRIMSAKMLRVKQLQNQLADAHYHLNELANENRLLKALQKRQDSALRKYEGTSAELPRIINSHHEELKVLQTKHKKLRTQHKHTCDMLKEKENEIHSLQSQNKHLLQLSKDRNLEERERLQMRVSDLNFRIQQQQETIQTLNRKLTLETKSLKHQLNAEVAKHKETQKNLHEALEKLKNLEDLLDNREKRLYYSGRLPICNKGKTIASQSLMNLGQNGIPSNPLKSGSKSRGSQNEAENGSLPKLTRTETSDGKTVPNNKVDHNDGPQVTETMSSLQQLRKFRLQKSYSRNGSASLTREIEESDASRNEINDVVAKSSIIDKLRSKRTTMNEMESDDDDDDDDDDDNRDVIKKFVDYETTNGRVPYKLPKELMKEFGYSSSDTESEMNTRENKKLAYESASLASKSRDLHTRLISDHAMTVQSVPSKLAKDKNSTNSSPSEPEAEVELKTASTAMENYAMALRERSKNGDKNCELSLEDFLKLDINGTDSDLETERIRKTNIGNPEKSSDSKLNDLLADDHETSQERLSSITKSWTELQAKINREREISENQLTALSLEVPRDKYLSENKLINGNEKENYGISSMTHEADKKHEESRRIVNSELLNIEDNIKIPYSRQNGSIRESISENDPSKRTEIIDVNLASTRYNRSDGIKRNFDDSTIAKNSSGNKEVSRSIETPIQIAENGISKDTTIDDSAEMKLVNYNKQKLLAAMKAIDDNENIDFVVNQKNRTPPNHSQSMITDNLYRGLPSHARKKDDILKDIFGDGKSETKLRAGCSKLH